MAERILAINPGCKVEEIEDFVSPDNLDQLLDRGFDFIIDAIDQALSSGITLNLSDRGGEVMAGKLAKPMSYELNYLAMRGR